MKQISIAVLLLSAATAQAGPLHWIRTHKYPLAMGAAMFFSGAADALSTKHAERVCGVCVDQGLGRNPSEAKIWTWTELGPAGAFAFGLAAYHHYRAGGSESSRGGQIFFNTFLSVPIVVHGIADTRDNLKAVPGTPANEVR